MPKLAKELTAIEVGRLKVTGYHFVGGVSGLALQVSSSGARSWILRTTIAGKRRDIGLGGFPTVTLAGARESARAIRAKIRDGIDPIAEKATARGRLAAERASTITFKEAAQKYIAANKSAWSNAKHSKQWATTLEKYTYPVIGALSVSVIDTPHIVSILEPIWNSKTETASRLRGRIEVVLDWCIARGFRGKDNPARWKGHLSSILPAAGRVKKVEHHPALDYRQIGSFMEELNAVSGTGARALEFAILTASRSGEVRGARWGEIDEHTKQWIIPRERMKAKREHRIPLSDAAMKLLSTMPRLEGTDYIFPSKTSKALSDMTLTAVIRRMNDDTNNKAQSAWVDHNGNTITVHGFRSTFRDWAGETTSYSREVIEHALAHQIPDKAEAAYARGTMFDKRRRLMDDWTEYCQKPALTCSTKVIQIKAAKK